MLTDIKFLNSYSSGYVEPKEFFTEALIESSTFDLGLGFFSSSGIRSLAYGFAVFIANKGKMRVVINDILSDEDKRAILLGQSQMISDKLCERIIKDIEKMKETFSKADDLFFRCFSYLISVKRIEFVATLLHTEVLLMINMEFSPILKEIRLPLLGLQTSLKPPLK